jgi:hypothetical protein
MDAVTRLTAFTSLTVLEELYQKEGHRQSAKDRKYWLLGQVAIGAVVWDAIASAYITVATLLQP